MERTLENELAEAYGEMLTLCLAPAADKAEKIFALMETRPGCRMFRALFLSQGKMLTPLELIGGNENLAGQFLEEGLKRMYSIASVFEKHKIEVPAEMKMQYSMEEGQFSSDYRYADQLPDEAKDPEDAYAAWRKELMAAEGR